LKRLSQLTILIAIASGCSRPTPEMQVIAEAADALGGANSIRSVKTISMEGGGMANNLGQARTPQGDDPVSPAEPTSTFEVTGFTRTLDLANGRARQQWHRTPKFASPNPDGVQNAGLDGDVAYTVASGNRTTRQPQTVAKARRFELILSHPIGIVRAALDPAAKITNLRQEGGNDLVDVTTAGGDTVTLAVDRTTHLPASVSTASYQPYLGDVKNETDFLDYQDVNGVKLPTHFVTKVEKWKESDITVKNTVNGAAGDLAAPADVKSTGAPPAAAQPQTVNVDEVAKGIWYLTGASENSALVEFSDHTELVEVPLGEARAEALFAKARELAPAKPLTKAIVTHAHFDHSGGIRRVIAEGLTVVTHEANKSFFEQMAKRSHTVQQDALARNPKEPTFELVTDGGLVQQDAMRTLRIVHFDDPTGHNAHMLMVYFPKEKILFNADLFNWGGNFVRYPRAVALDEAIKKNGLDVQTHLPVHGKKGSRKDFEGVLQALKEGRQPEGLGLLNRQTS
jgi:glyoxylase-like metal-dependent hydrolase (beta-lactamase superfamily II)